MSLSGRGGGERASENAKDNGTVKLKKSSKASQHLFLSALERARRGRLQTRELPNERTRMSSGEKKQIINLKNSCSSIKAVRANIPDERSSEEQKLL